VVGADPPGATLDRHPGRRNTDRLREPIRLIRSFNREHATEEITDKGTARSAALRITLRPAPLSPAAGIREVPHAVPHH